MNYEEIGHFIAMLRKEKNLTQKELANQIGVTDKAISKWERGLGCPDVSLLESLSIVLNVTILEILKGRYISREEITNENINSLVLETVNYSKKQMHQKYKKIILNFLTIIMIVIIGYLSILNWNHIRYLKMKDYYNFNSTWSVQLQNQVATLEEKINQIKSSKLRYSESDFKEIIEKLDWSLSYFKNNPLLNYKGHQGLTINDLFIVDLYDVGNLSLIQGYQILIKYDESLHTYLDYYQTTAITKMLTGYDLYIEPQYAYKYHINIPNQYERVNYKVSARVLNTLSSVREMNLFCDSVMEVGAIHE